MSDDSNVFEIHRVEQHWLPTCQCADCRAEKIRRAAASPPAGPRLIHVPPAAALVFGILRRRSPGGSLARSLAGATN